MKDFAWKILAATFAGNYRVKICEIFRQNVAAFFVRVSEQFHLNFALGNFLHKKLAFINRAFRHARVRFQIVRFCTSNQRFVMGGWMCKVLDLEQKWGLVCRVLELRLPRKHAEANVNERGHL